MSTCTWLFPCAPFGQRKSLSWSKNILDLNLEEAKENYQAIKDKYPFVITRDIKKAKQWLKQQARGTERYGIVVSSQAIRLKPYAIDVKSPMDPIHWFLDGITQRFPKQEMLRGRKVI